MRDSMMDVEPGIVQAKFYLNETRIYSLDFDQNIEMKDLKKMIKAAAHLKTINFRFYCEGKEYSQYNEESFESIFPNQKHVVFHLQKDDEDESFDESEFVLQINSPCEKHPEKFLLFYCFDCDCSVCSDCFTSGEHQGHNIQDKCFYLLNSRFLIEKLFESWSNNPYEDYKISTDLSEYKNKINNVFFGQLFKMLKGIQYKCNELIDVYNNININSVKNIRDSVRDIKCSCVKVLDNLKETLNVKDIVTNVQVFKQIDNSYKELGRAQKEKFNKNLDIFRELNQQISFTLISLIENIYKTIFDTLQKASDDAIYNDMKNKINEKLVNPVDQNSIINNIA